MDYQIINQLEELDAFVKFADGKVFFRGHDLYKSKAVFEVKKIAESSYFFTVVGSSGSIYGVNIIFNQGRISHSCTCPYTLTPICKHKVAAALQLKDVLGKDVQEGARFQAMTVPGLDLANFSETKYFNTSKINKAAKISENKGVKKIKDDNQAIICKVSDGLSFEVIFQFYKRSHLLRSYCTCIQDGPCEHMLASLYYLSAKYGSQVFFDRLDFSEEKAQLLKESKINPKDPIVPHLEFSADENGYKLLYQGKMLDNITNFKGFVHGLSNDPEDLEVKKLQDEEIVVFIIDLNRANIPIITPAVGKLTKNKSRLKGQISELNSDQTSQYSYLMNATLQELIFRALDIRNRFTSDVKYKSKEKLFKELMSKSFRLIKDLKNQWIFLNEGGYSSWRGYVPRQLEKVRVSEDQIVTSLVITEEEMAVRLKPSFSLKNKEGKIHIPVQSSYHLISLDDELIPWSSYDDYSMAQYFNFDENIEKIFSKHDSNTNIEHLINTINNKFNTHMPELQNKISESPVAKIYLSESDPFLIITPVIAYGDFEFSIKDEIKSNVVRKDGSFFHIERDKAYENEVLAFIVQLHDDFDPNTYLEYFYLHQKQVLEDFWFMDFYQKCNEQNIQIFGLKELRSIKYSPHRPRVSYQIKSDINWFDLEIQIQYGDQKASLKNLRKAIVNRQDYVRLNDGSLGLLPSEWLEKFHSMIELGSIDDQSVKLPKTHFLLVERLYHEAEQKDSNLLYEFAEKKKLLDSFKEIENVRKPRQLKANLRDYQKGGLNWFNFLAKFEWGGCLADDMGLGKTLQMLAFFLHLKENNPDKTLQFLVVCPTTLLFNWQNEIEKFCPDLAYFVHWGANRPTNSVQWQQNDIILTSYGTMVNDIALFKEHLFEVAVLDESQAIKNPSSLRYKACRVLQAHHRFVLTGTPIENNSVELFAQMNFLNPGLLGSLNAYKKNFATAIERDNNPKTLQYLKDILKPFILRRTKEEVAKELPEKTEMVMFCEMQQEQREVYEAFRDEIRTNLMTKIAEEGLKDTRFNVLEGILKLRQICDSPALLKDRGDFGSASIKADELLRHVEEKTGNHKILIFSQFVKMLQIISRRLDGHKITYAYIDGQTKKRGEEVAKFQEDENVRVFLISLKAGGTGLNLTAADYVYLVDPWWNPAVETQAIDRAHRIGQDKHVFAYKMICKDTIEDKILALQKKKKDLADELITSEGSFVKTLSKSDIEMLFS